MARGDFRSYAEIAQLWYDEVAFYDFENPGTTPTVAGEAVGHFAAMIGADARDLGCGQDGKTFVCSYWDGGKEKSCSTVNITSNGRENCYATRVPPPDPDAVCD